jgi:uncharacterized cysteine cluster protein YcgN (CxxCxxCC family)
MRGLSAVTNLRRPCIHLDTTTRTCTVYEKRFETCSACRKMTLRHALFVRWLPKSCGYVQRYRVWARSRFRYPTPRPTHKACHLARQGSRDFDVPVYSTHANGGLTHGLDVTRTRIRRI